MVSQNRTFGGTTTEFPDQSSLPGIETDQVAIVTGNVKPALRPDRRESYRPIGDKPPELFATGRIVGRDTIVDRGTYEHPVAQNNWLIRVVEAELVL